nr:hypothetical protein [Tessaracoccus coleopterorum]
MDKNLRAHGLIQAYSRTNRILNSVKTYGNIVAFRDLEDETNAALELFGNKDARGLCSSNPTATTTASTPRRSPSCWMRSRWGSRSSARLRRRSSSSCSGRSCGWRTS